MPTYDFECQGCDDVQEIKLPIDFKGEVNCGHCGTKLTKMFPVPGIHFKGDGWGSK